MSDHSRDSHAVRPTGEPTWFRIFRPLEWLGMAAVIVLMLHVVTDTAMRFLFNAPLGGTIEFVANWWMVAIVFVGVPLAARRGEHIEAPVLWSRLRTTDQRVTQLLSYLLTIGAVSVMAFYAWRGARAAHMRGDYSGGGAGNVLLWPPRYLVATGLALFALYVIYASVRLIATMRSDGVGDDAEKQRPLDGLT